jgi:polar amino acid transport system substrate-binding protein
MLLRFALSCVLLLGAMLSPASAEKPELLVPGKLLVAVEGTYPPFSMRSPDGGFDGLEVRVLKEIAKRMGLEYTPVVAKWDSLLVGLMSDKFDVSGATMDITPEREKQVLFSDAWLESVGCIVVTANDTGIKMPQDLKGRHVGALVASTWTKMAQEQGAVVKTDKAEADALQDLVNGNIDAVITDKVAAGYEIKKSGLPVKMAYSYDQDRVQKGFAIKKSNVNLAKAVDDGLASMVKDGTYAKLTTDLVGFDTSPADPLRTKF